MRFEDGRPTPDTKEEILSGIISSAEEAFGEDFTPDERSVIRAHYDPIAEYLAGQQQDIATVLDSAQIDHAEGGALDLLASLVGVVRNPADSAETRIRFEADGPVPQDYTVPGGTVVQTDATDPIVFETDSGRSLERIDDFEGSNLDNYSGDTGTFSLSTTNPYEGSQSLEASASTGTITDTSFAIPYGSTLHVRQFLDNDTIAGTLFGTQDIDNTYRAVLDASNDDLILEVVDGGTATEIDSISGSIPENEWIHTEIDWQHEAGFEIAVHDSTGTEIVTLEAEENEQTYDDGGIGFYSGGSTSTKRWDAYTMSAVGVDATSRAIGSETNVSAGVLEVLQSGVAGVSSVTNPIPASGGQDEEGDGDLRARAKQELSEGMRASQSALIDNLESIDETQTVTVITNDDSTTDADGRPPHASEPIVEAPTDAYEEIAETLIDTKAAGDPLVGGYAGTAVTRTVTLPNDQTKDVEFSSPTTVNIYANITIDVEDTYEGDDQVRDNIVNYIGGVLSSGANFGGQLNAGDDIVYNRVLDVIMDIEGVYDVTTLEIGTSDPPSGTSNVSIADTEVGHADATDTSLDITTNEA